MKPLLLVLLLTLLSCAQTFAQHNEANPLKIFGTYEDQRKEPATAFVSSFIIPGAGFAYLNEPIYALIFAGAEATTFNWTLNERKLSTVWFPLTILILEKVVEFDGVLVTTDKYNQNLRKSLGFGVSWSPDRGAIVGLSYPL